SGRGTAHGRDHPVGDVRALFVLTPDANWSGFQRPGAVRAQPTTRGVAMTHAAVQSHPSQTSTATASHRRSPGAGLLARLSGERIAASASAITLNAAVLMLMLVPLAATQLLPETTIDTEIRFIPRDPPPLVPPVPVPVTSRPLVPQTPTLLVRRQPVTPPAVAATAEPGDTAAPYEATVIEGDTDLTPSIATPQTGAQLQ